MPWNQEPCVLFKEHCIKDHQSCSGAWLAMHKQSALYLSGVPHASGDPHTLVCVQISLKQDPGDLRSIPLDRAFL